MKFRGFLAATATALALAAVQAHPARAVVVDFGSSPGHVTPTTIDGVMFSSAGDPGAYVVGPNAGLFETLGAEVLSSAGVVNDLTMTVAAPVTNLDFTFALDDLLGSGDTLTLTFSSGQVLIANTSVPVGFLFPEGAFDDASLEPFTSVTLSSTDPIVISDLTVGSVSSVPEPTTFAVLGMGLIGLVASRRFRS